MTEQNLIKKEDAICLLEDDSRVFLIEQDGKYMTAARMVELAEKMKKTAHEYANAIAEFNRRRGQ